MKNNNQFKKRITIWGKMGTTKNNENEGDADNEKNMHIDA